MKVLLLFNWHHFLIHKIMVLLKISWYLRLDKMQ